MLNLASPLQVAAVVAAIAWPFAAGLALVIWSKTRAADRQRKLAALDAELRGMFQAAEAQPAPDRLTLVVDALEEGQALKRAGAGADADRTQLPTAR